MSQDAYPDEFVDFIESLDTEFKRNLFKTVHDEEPIHFNDLNQMYPSKPEEEIYDVLENEMSRGVIKRKATLKDKYDKTYSITEPGERFILSMFLALYCNSDQLVNIIEKHSSQENRL